MVNDIGGNTKLKGSWDGRASGKIQISLYKERRYSPEARRVLNSSEVII